MKALVVYAHPNSASFSNGILKTVVDSLQAKGTEVTVRDLYATNYNPVLSAQDLAGVYSGNVPKEILDEQALIAEADSLIFIYPLWWAGFPAILKGWIDRNLTFGFAYKVGDQSIEGLLKGKKALSITPHGTPKEYYEPVGMYKSLVQTQDDGVWAFCGIEADHLFYSVMNTDQSGREAYLKEIKAKVEAL